MKCECKCGMWKTICCWFLVVVLVYFCHWIEDARVRLRGGAGGADGRR